MHPNEELVTRFYSALQRRDAAGMAACYHSDVTFSDPAFPGLSGDRARAMWAMLAERGTDLTVAFSGVRADDTTGAAHWEADYTFSMTGKKVHNVIDARFTFKDGLIITHADTFNFKRWASQALGFTGKLLGGMPFLQKKVQATGAKALDAFIAKKS